MKFTGKDYGRWVLQTQSGYDSLEYTETPLSFPLGPDDVLVRLYAASLNPRDIGLSQGTGKALGFPPTKPSLVPGSDGAGVVLEIGSAVTSFHAGDKVVTHITPHIPDDALPTMAQSAEGLGHRTDGTLRRLGVFHHTALVHMPRQLSFAEAATLTCSGLTAWNALMGAPGRSLQPSDYVLVQGTGGVSIAALQIAVAAGATVIATTSNDEKAARLQALGATHVINYQTTPDWGKVARSFTPNGRGVDYVVDIGGYATIQESITATRLNGVVSVTGASGGFEAKSPDVLQVLWAGIILRGILTGGRQMFRDMVNFIEEKNLKPALDDVSFDLRDAKKAYERLEGKKHFSKVVVKMD